MKIKEDDIGNMHARRSSVNTFLPGLCPQLLTLKTYYLVLCQTTTHSAVC